MINAKSASLLTGLCLSTFGLAGACGTDESDGGGTGASAGEDTGGTAGDDGSGGKATSTTGGRVTTGGSGQVATGGSAGQDAGAGGAPEGEGGGGAAAGGDEGGGAAGADVGVGGAAGEAGAGGLTECAADCACEEGETCDYECTAECTVECLGTSCTAHCPEGGCTLDADLGAVVSYTCEGGNCETDCDTESECTVNCPGGGCQVGCDADSRCDVICSETGDPCEVTCGAGALATCSGNCDVQNCEPCDPTPDPDYMPEIDPANFSNVIDNPLYPLPVGATWVYEAPDEVITVTVLDETYTILGVDCAVVRDTVRTPEGELIEDTIDWYAQDSDGNVWYFGEDTAEYVNGEVANTLGSWEAGVDGALPGIIMQASPEVGMRYYQEYLVCEAEDEGEVIAVGESASVPAGDYEDCVRTRDFTDLDPLSNEYKTFCPGVGLVFVTDPESGERLEELTSISLP